MNPRQHGLLHAGLALGVSLVAIAIIEHKVNDHDGPTQTSAAIVSPAPVQTIAYAPVTTAPATTSTTTTAVSAHDALQEELDDPSAFVLAELDPSLPCLEWAPLALEVGWPAEQLPTLLRILWKESRCQPWADSGPDHGLAQVNQIHTEYLAILGLTHEDMKDPRENLAFALRLWSEREARGKCGWTPWSVTCD